MNFSSLLNTHTAVFSKFVYINHVCAYTTHRRNDINNVLKLKNSYAFWHCVLYPGDKLSSFWNKEENL